MRVVAARVSKDEYVVLEAKSRDAGLSIGGYLRATGLGDPGPRARRQPTVNAELLAHAVAQLNRVGNNLNQLTRRLNSAAPVGANDSSAAIAETRAAIRRICDILNVD